MSRVPKVSVVIPARNCADLLKINLECLRKQTYPFEDFEVIVVDDCGTDNLTEQIKPLVPAMPFALSVLRRDNNGGPGATRNTGIAAARGEIIALLDADTEPDPDWIANGVRAIDGYDVAEGYTEIGSPEQITPFTHQTQNLKPGGFPTCNMFLMKRVFDDVGLFDTRFYDPAARIHFREDTELALRLIKHNAKITFARDSKVIHRPLSPSWKRPIQLAKRYRHDRLLRQLHPDIYNDWNDVYFIAGRKFHQTRQKVYWLYLAGIVALMISAFSGYSIWPGLLATSVGLLGSWFFHVRPMGKRAISLMGLAALPVAAVVPFVFLSSIIAGTRLHPGKAAEPYHIQLSKDSPN